MVGSETRSSRRSAGPVTRARVRSSRSERAQRDSGRSVSPTRSDLAVTAMYRTDADNCFELLMYTLHAQVTAWLSRLACRVEIVRRLARLDRHSSSGCTTLADACSCLASFPGEFCRTGRYVSLRVSPPRKRRAQADVCLVMALLGLGRMPVRPISAALPNASGQELTDCSVFLLRYLYRSPAGPDVVCTFFRFACAICRLSPRPSPAR